MAGMRYRAAAAEAALAVLRDAAGTWLPTGEVAELAGFGVRHGQVIYNLLRRLERRGQVVVRRPADYYSVWWLWSPNEATCDADWQIPDQPACVTPCMADDSRFTIRGCQGCRLWALRELGQRSADGRWLWAAGRRTG